MQNRQGGRRRRGGTGGGNNPRPMGMAQGSQGANRLEVRVRGNANQLLEKYKVLARDAHQAGDRVATEYYLQHADHYFRVLNDSRIRAEEMRSRRGPFDQLEEEYEPEGDTQESAGDEDDDRSQDQERTQDRNREPNRRPRDDRPYEARADRPQRDADRPQRDADRSQRDDRPPRDQNRPQRDADRPQRWQQDNRGSEGQRDSQAREGQAREGQAREGQAREGQARESQARQAPVREYQPRSNGNRHAADEDRSHGDAMLASADDGPRISDGEAALAAFGGPIREAAPRQADPIPEADAAPAPRKRGRPRKVDVAPVAEG